MSDQAQPPPGSALSWTSLPLDEDVARLIRAQQRFSQAPPDIPGLQQLLVELCLSVVHADGATLDEVDGEDLVCAAGHGRLAPSVGSREPRDRSLAGLVVATGQPQLSVDVARDERLDPDACPGVGSMALHPIRRGQVTRAVLTVVSRRPHGLSEREVAVLQPLVQMAESRLDQVAAINERHAADEMLAKVSQASRAILVAEEPAEELCRWARRLVDAPYSMYLQPDDNGNLVTAAQSGAELEPMVLPPGRPSMMRDAFDTGRLCLVSDDDAHPKLVELIARARTEAALADATAGAAFPVTSGGEPIGVLALLLGTRIKTADAALLGLVNVLGAEAGLAIERGKLQRLLERQARYDALTGVPNRRVWMERLALEMARAGRSHNPLCLAILDLDHFKEFNDTRGHQAGDELLRAVAAAWSGHTRETDLLARLGGEEFGLVLPDTSLEAGQVIGQRLLAAVPAGMTVSAGLAQWAGEDADTLYRRADEALYAAKAGGRNRLATAP